MIYLFILQWLYLTCSNLVEDTYAVCVSSGLCVCTEVCVCEQWSVCVYMCVCVCVCVFVQQCDIESAEADGCVYSEAPCPSANCICVRVCVCVYNRTDQMSVTLSLIVLRQMGVCT